MGSKKAKAAEAARLAVKQAAREEAVRQVIQLAAGLALAGALILMQDPAARERLVMWWHKRRSRLLMGFARTLALQSSSADAAGRLHGEMLWAASVWLADLARLQDASYEEARAVT